MSEPVNGGPASNEAAGPSPAAHPEPMDTTTDEPRAETQPEPTSQPEASVQSEANPQTTAPGPPPTNATASPKPEPTPTGADDESKPGAQTVREVLNTKINPFVSAGLRQIFQDPANIPKDPLRILGEFLLEKHREIAAKESEAGQTKTDGTDS